MTENYAAKVRAAMLVLRYRFSQELSDMEEAETHLAKSFDAYLKLAQLARDTYHFANSLQTSHRKIPFPGGSNGNPADVSNPATGIRTWAGARASGTSQATLSRTTKT